MTDETKTTGSKPGLFLKFGKLAVPIQGTTLVAVIAFGFGAYNEVDDFKTLQASQITAIDSQTSAITEMKAELETTNEEVKKNSELRPELEALRSKHETDMKALGIKIEALSICVRSKLRKCEVY